MGLLFKVRIAETPERLEDLPRAASFQGKRKTEFDEARYGPFILANRWNSIWGWQVVILCKGMIGLFFGANHSCAGSDGRNLLSS